MSDNAIEPEVKWLIAFWLLSTSLHFLRCPAQLVAMCAHFQTHDDWFWYIAPYFQMVMSEDARSRIMKPGGTDCPLGISLKDQGPGGSCAICDSFPYLPSICFIFLTFSYHPKIIKPGGTDCLLSISPSSNKMKDQINFRTLCALWFICPLYLPSHFIFLTLLNLFSQMCWQSLTVGTFTGLGALLWSIGSVLKHQK